MGKDEKVKKGDMGTHPNGDLPHWLISQPDQIIHTVQRQKEKAKK